MADFVGLSIMPNSFGSSSNNPNNYSMWFYTNSAIDSSDGSFVFYPYGSAFNIGNVRRIGLNYFSTDYVVLGESNCSSVGQSIDNSGSWQKVKSFSKQWVSDFSDCRIFTVLSCHNFHSPLFSKTLSFADFDLEFCSNSSSPGRIGLFVITRPLETLPQVQIGKDGGQIQGFSAFFIAILTILSSNEWKVMMQSLPPGFKSAIISSSVSLNTSSSWLHSILIA